MSINRQGTLALVANRSEGTVSVFGIQGKTVTPLSKVTIAPAASGVSHAAFTPDGKTALVTRDGDNFISVLAIDGTKVEYTKRDLSAGLRPYGLDISRDGSVAVVANIGRGGGDNDTISLIDLKAKPPRVVETVIVGQTPEGILLSPDGKLVAVTVMNGSNKPRESPFFNDAGKLILYRVDGTRLIPIAAAFDRTLVAGRRVLRGQQHDPRRQHGGAQCPGAPLGRHLAHRSGGADPGQRGLGGASHRGPPVAAATTAHALPARREVRNVGKGKNMKKEKKKPKQKK